MTTLATETQSEWIEELLAQLGRQDRLCHDLLGLAHGQAVFIENGDSDCLLKLLQRRQALLAELVKLQTVSAPLTARLEETRHELTRQEQVNAYVEAISGGLAEIMEIDATDQDALRSRLEEISKRMTTSGTAQVARKAYGDSGGLGALGPVVQSPRFTDRQG